MVHITHKHDRPKISDKITSILFKRALPLTIADTAAKGATFIIALLIARSMGPFIYGQYATAASICGILMLFAGIGFEQELTRRGGLEKEKTGYYLRLNLASLFGSLVLSYFVLAVFLFFSKYPWETVSITLLFGIGYSINRMQLPFRYYCLLKNEVHITATAQILSIFVNIGITLLIIYYTRNIAFILLGQIGLNGLTLAFWFYWCPDKLIAKDSASFKKIIDFTKYSIPFALSNILWVMYFNFDTFIMSLFDTETNVGIYAGIYRIIGINYILGYAITNSFTPVLYESYLEGKDSFSLIAKKLIRLKLIFGAVFGTLLLSISPYLILYVVGDRYIAGLPIARILCVAVFFRFLNFALCEILTTSANQRKRVIYEAYMLLVNIVFNLLLIPKFGGVGAAAATLLSEIFLTLCVSVSCMRLLSSK